MKRWSKKEEKILFKAVQDSPDNLAYAFRKVSRKLGKSDRAVSQKWYATYHNNPEKVNMAYALVSKSRVYRNTKQYSKDIMPVKTKKGFWKGLVDLIKEQF